MTNKANYEENVVEKKKKLQSDLELHRRKAELARMCKKEDMELAKGDDAVKVITFDLQRTLPTPLITSNIAYYSRQLWTFNFGIHEDIGLARMYVWDESVASHGSRELGSCLMNFVSSIPDSIKHVIGWSDSCGG